MHTKDIQHHINVMLHNVNVTPGPTPEWAQAAGSFAIAASLSMIAEQMSISHAAQEARAKEAAAREEHMMETYAAQADAERREETSIHIIPEITEAGSRERLFEELGLHVPKDKPVQLDLISWTIAQLEHIRTLGDRGKQAALLDSLIVILKLAAKGE